jgi:hypothetical protein
VAGQWRTIDERRRDLERLVEAFALNADVMLPRIDRLVSAILHEHHPDIVAWLVASNHPPTWEGAATAAERLACIEAEIASVQILDDALFAAVGGAVILARPANA